MVAAKGKGVEDANYVKETSEEWIHGQGQSQIEREHIPFSLADKAPQTNGSMPFM